MGHYKSNVRDQVFNLFEVFEVDKALGEGEFSDLDRETAEEWIGQSWESLVEFGVEQVVLCDRRSGSNVYRMGLGPE